MCAWRNACARVSVRRVLAQIELSRVEGKKAVAGDVTYKIWTNIQQICDNNIFYMYTSYFAEMQLLKVCHAFQNETGAFGFAAALPFLHKHVICIQNLPLL